MVACPTALVWNRTSVLLAVTASATSGLLTATRATPSGQSITIPVPVVNVTSTSSPGAGAAPAMPLPVMLISSTNRGLKVFIAVLPVGEVLPAGVVLPNARPALAWAGPRRPAPPPPRFFDSPESGARARVPARPAEHPLRPARGLA